MAPDVSQVRPVVRALTAAGLDCALGGSGLLYSLGLVDQVRDWDLTTEAPPDAVRGALRALRWQESAYGDGPFATSYRLAIISEGREVDLMGRFTIRTDRGLCHLPTIVCGEWAGVPTGSPEVWAVAYRLMGRHEKARLLSEYVRRTGARPAAVAQLLAQPLPDGVRTEVAGWAPLT